MNTVAYNYGCWYFSNDTMVVRVSDEIYQHHLNAYLQSQGIDTRTYLELLAYIDQVLRQRIEAAKHLHTPEYWRTCTDPTVYCYPVANIQQRSTSATLHA